MNTELVPARAAKLPNSLLALTLSLSVCANVAAITLNPGDIIVADENAFGNVGAIFKVDPACGPLPRPQEIISSSGGFVDPEWVVLDADGTLLVSDLNARAIYRVNPALPYPANQTTVSSGQYFVQPRGIALRSDGSILVADNNAVGGGGAIIRVDPSASPFANQTIFAQDGPFVDPAALALRANGDVFVVDWHAGDAGKAAVIQVDSTGMQKTIRFEWDSLAGIASDSAGRVLLTDPMGKKVLRVNPASADPVSGVWQEYEILSEAGLLAQPWGITTDDAGQIFITDYDALPVGGAKGAVIKIDPATCTQAPISWGGEFESPAGILIVPTPDSDGDGVPNGDDACPGTPPGAIVDFDGCSIDQLVPCAGPAAGGVWKNHGKYVSSVAKAAQDFLNAGLITEDQKDQIVGAAAESKCGKK